MEPHVTQHADGSIQAKGMTKDGIQEGYWEWFRADGTKLRSGYFSQGQKVGAWTTYDAEGKVYKTTSKGPRSGDKPADPS